MLLGTGDDPLRFLLGLFDDPLALGVDPLRRADFFGDSDPQLVDEPEGGCLVDDDVVRQGQPTAVRDDRLEALDEENDVDRSGLRWRSTGTAGRWPGLSHGRRRVAPSRVPWSGSRTNGRRSAARAPLVRRLVRHADQWAEEGRKSGLCGSLVRRLVRHADHAGGRAGCQPPRAASARISGSTAALGIIAEMSPSNVAISLTRLDET